MGNDLNHLFAREWKTYKPEIDFQEFHKDSYLPSLDFSRLHMRHYIDASENISYNGVLSSALYYKGGIAQVISFDIEDNKYGSCLGDFKIY